MMPSDLASLKARRAAFIDSLDVMFTAGYANLLSFAFSSIWQYC
jgi:hypothetical protein